MGYKLVGFHLRRRAIHPDGYAQVRGMLILHNMKLIRSPGLGNYEAEANLHIKSVKMLSCPSRKQAQECRAQKWAEPSETVKKKAG